jgi:transposase-like protein
MKTSKTEAAGLQALFIDGGEELRKHVRALVRQAIGEIAQQEVGALCGARHSPEEGEYRRAGSAPSYVFTDAGRERMQRPRVRRETGEGSEEVALKSWKAAQSPEEWEAATMRAVLCGVSTRDVGALRESEVRGQSDSSVSRLWQRKSAELVREVQDADLSWLDLLVLMIDAVVLGEGLVATVALGIDSQGAKHVLGFRIGSTENAEVCRDLLGSLSRRGLKAPGNRYLLGVLDGSEALRSALLEVYPRTVIQRCLVHKERNLRSYLPKRHWAELARLFKRLRRCQGPEQAGEAAEAIGAFLADKNQQARDSWAEPGEEALTLPRLNVPNGLHKSLLSTNCIDGARQRGDGAALRRRVRRAGCPMGDPTNKTPSRT